MDAHEQRIVRFLSNPRSYPHPAGAVGRRETHVSHVFLAGPFAYKLKKPVTFPFLDASTLARRKRFCELELSLNRRLAPDVYLTMVPIVETREGLRLGGTGRMVEWVVKMRRLPEERMLDRLVAGRRIGARDMVRIADRLMPFFVRAERGAAVSRYGTPASVARLVLGNLEECAPFLGTLFTEAERQRLAAAYRQYLTLEAPLLARRWRERRIIDGHGDLRCENICMSTPPAGGGAARARHDVAIFDCVEFQPAFRCADVVNDFSFLVMDLEFRGRRDLADVLLAEYRRRMSDPTFDRILAFYQCHRSLVRGKVRGFAWLQHPRALAGRRVRALSRRHFRLAVRYAARFAPPRLLVVGGLIGSGKSTLARGLAEGLGAVWLRTDEIRLREFTVPSAVEGREKRVEGRRRKQGFAEGLYAPHVSELVYQRLIQRAESLLRQGRSVVCDGTFSKAVGRGTLRDIARRHGASFHFFECTVPRAIALRRIARRAAAQSDISEARPEHYTRLKAGFEPVRGWPARDWTRISDDRAPRATYEVALKALRRAWSL